MRWNLAPSILGVSVICGLACLGASDLQAEPPADSPRVTPLVRIIQAIEPAVVGLFVPNPDGRGLSSGSGTIIHPAGFVLTNHHVLPQNEGFALYRGKPLRFETVGRLPEKDIAIVRLLGAPGPFPFLQLGHSHDIMNGESVVVAGNPGGRGIVFTSGIVSSRQVMIDAPNALVMTQFNTDRRDKFIQFDAASNRGNSGGPLVNMDREVIGIVSAAVPQEQNVGFAIPIDRVRELFDRLLDPEVIHEKTLGVRLNTLADPPPVTEVIPGSSAAQAGLRVGDVLVSADESPIRCSADWTMHLTHQLRQANSLSLIVRRGDERLPVKLTPVARESFSPTEEKMEPGLRYDLHHKRITRLSEFREDKPASSGVTTDLRLEPIRGEQQNDYVLKLDGFLKIPVDGLYRLAIVSDDGSRLIWHGELFLDNDGNHPSMAAGRLLRARAGWHPLRVEYFQGTGEQVLEIQLERFEGSKIVPVKPIEFGHRP